MLTESCTRVKQADPCKGKWCVNGKEFSVWVDGSSLVTRVTMGSGGSIVEYECWLRPDSETQHINIAESNAVIRGVNRAIQWGGGAKTVHLRMHSLCMHKWLADTL